MAISDTAATERLLNQLRSQYLDSLYEFQDFHSESLNRDAARRLLWNGNEAIGYVLTDRAGTVLEFYIVDERLAETAFDHVVRAHSMTQAFCKTFDPLLLSLCLGRATRAKPMAVLFLTIADATFTQNEAIAVRLAEASDLARIKSIDDGFFDDDNEVLTYIEHCYLFLYEEGSELIGCGLAQPVIEGRTAYDVGMLVSPSRRKQEFGEYIVRHLKAYCLSKGLRPVCDCGIENAASRACLEAAGFRSRHRMIEFGW